MSYVDVVQNTPEWLWERCGRVTASEVYRAMSFLKRGGSSEDRENYKAEITGEIMTGDCTEHYVSRYMKEGKEREPKARAAYEIRTGIDVDTTGFFVHPAIDRAGASPDALIGAEGLVEFKCPQTKTHLRYILEGVVPDDYRDQMQFQMACTGRQWCDFVTFDDRVTARYQLCVVARLERDEGRIAELNDGVRLFLREVDAQLAALDERMPELPKPAPENLGELGLTEADLDYLK